MIEAIIFDFYNVLYNPREQEIDRDILELIKSLNKKYTLYLFTNSSKEFLNLNDSKTAFLSLFSKHISVMEHGYHKPDKDSFDLLFKEIEFKPKSIIFIDDKEENIKQAKIYGLNTIQYQNGSLLKEQLKEYNINIGV